MRRSPLDRPIVKLFVLGLVLLVGVVLGAALLGGGDDDDGGEQAAPPPPPAAPAPRDDAIVKGETDRELLAAQRVARRFIDSYLPVLYGRRTVSTIEGASPALRADLKRNQRRLPPAMLDRDPRVQQVDVVRQADRAVQATATIADGDVSTYPLIFYLERGPQGWQATRLGDD